MKTGTFRYDSFGGEIGALMTLAEYTNVHRSKPRPACRRKLNGRVGV